MVVHELAPEFWGRVSGPLAALSGSSSKAPGFAGGYLPFDICSLVYRMPDHYLQVDLRLPLAIIRNLLDWMASVAKIPSLREGLLAIDDSRPIFDRAEKLPALITLHSELSAIYVAAVLENGGYSMATEDHVAAA